MCLPYSVTPSNYAFCDGWQRLIRRSTPANGDGQRPNVGQIWLLQGIEPDYHRSEGYRRPDTSRYFQLSARAAPLS
jgi:hypothetical protein